MNINAGEGLQDVLKSNLGPLGTIKMSVCSGTLSQGFADITRLVDGAGAVCYTVMLYGVLG